MNFLSQQQDVEHQLVLVRVDFNVPIESGRILDDFRIVRALPTLQLLVSRGARVIIIAHLGRDGTESLKSVADVLHTHIPTIFVSDINEARKRAIEGTVTLVENLRSDPREMANDDAFAQELAEGFDLFVQDAFAVCHREHASIVGIPKYAESVGGLLVHEEVRALQDALHPEKPSLFILGGGKVHTKEPLLRKMLPVYDAVFIGGILQNEILAARGMEIGTSKVEDRAVPFSILTTEKAYEITDVVVEHITGEIETIGVDDVNPTDAILDMGSTTVNSLIASLNKFHTIVWNGPLGWYERGFDDATIQLAHAIGRTQATSIIGGGDTVAVLEQEGLIDSFTFVSTGGGAMLQFLQDGSLVGIEALASNKKTHKE